MVPSRRLVALVLLSALAAGAVPLLAQEPARGGLVVRVLTPRFRTVEEMLSVVQPLLSDEGSVLIQTRSKSLTVKDRESVIERISLAVNAADVPPRILALSVTLLRAGPGGAAGPAKGSPEAPYMNGIGERLKKLFSFESYSVLESVSFQGTEGSAAGFAMGRDYRLDFRLDRSLDNTTFRLKDVVLSRQRTGGSRPGWTDLLRTAINVPPGQPFVLGVGRDESAKGALFLVFIATDASPGPGIVGVR
jgi:hypothetical protein